MNATPRNVAFVPRQPTWLIASTAAAATAIAGYLLLQWLAPWSPGRFWGLTAGTLAAALFGIAALYPARRRLCMWPLQTVQSWLQFHIYGGVLGMLLVLIHVGFRLPGGKFGWALLLLSVWTTATGLFGVYLQKTIPLVMARNFQVEAIYERIPELVRQLGRDADAAMEGASDIAARSYRSTVRKLLEAPDPSWSYVLDPRAGRTRLLEPLAQLEPFVDQADRGRLSAVERIASDKLDLDVHMSLQRALRAWLVVHVPAAAVLLGLMVVHVVAVLYL
jgi:hypothetical protein